MLPSFRLVLAAGLLCLAACQRSPDAAAARPPSAGAPPSGAAAPANATPPPAPAAVPDNATTDGAVADHYACEAGTELTLQEDGSFRAVIPGNAPVRLSRIAGSSPPVFTGASLYLRIEGNGDAILSQGDRTNELRCTPVQAPA